MYISRSVLILVILIYLLFLISVDWINQADSVWYRPFLVGMLIVAIGGWTHREQETDDL